MAAASAWSRHCTHLHEELQVTLAAVALGKGRLQSDALVSVLRTVCFLRGAGVVEPGWNVPPQQVQSTASCVASREGTVQSSSLPHCQVYIIPPHLDALVPGAQLGVAGGAVGEELVSLHLSTGAWDCEHIKQGRCLEK